MKRASMTMTLIATILSFSQGAQAGNDIRIAEVCAEAAQISTGEHRYTTIGVKKDHGFNRYSVWLNHKDKSARVYCRVNTSQVTELVMQDGTWSRHRLKSPQAPVLAAK